MSLLVDPLTLEGFEAVFRASPDPWGTRTRRDEAIKRTAILRAVGGSPSGASGCQARLLELGSGNGSNSPALAARALRLLATDGAPSAVALTRAALTGKPRAGAALAVLPGDLPRGPWQACVIAEVLYYLSEADIRRLAHGLSRELAPRAQLVLAHHHRHFPDTATPPARCHDRLLAALKRPYTRQTVARRRHWRVERVNLLQG